jgi:hypothetical protein
VALDFDNAVFRDEASGFPASLRDSDASFGKDFIDGRNLLSNECPQIVNSFAHSAFPQ